MVRLVFRPYTQIRRTICTSVSLRASTRVSPGFTLLRYSSPSFGSQQVCLHSNLSPKIEVGCYYKNYNCHFHYAHTVSRHVLAHVCGLLGPCFKTGHLKPLTYRCHEPRVPCSTTLTVINACAVTLSERHYARICGGYKKQISHQT